MAPEIESAPVQPPSTVGPAALASPVDTDAPIGAIRPQAEPKPDPLAMLAIDANALRRAILSGLGTDVSALVSELLRERPAA